MADECYKYLVLTMDRIVDATCAPIPEMVAPAFYMAKQYAEQAQAKCGIQLPETLKQLERGFSAAKEGNIREAKIASSIARLNLLEEVEKKR
jgi:hypothetical protein